MNPLGRQPPSLFAVTLNWCAKRSRRARCGGGALPYPPGVLCVVPGEIWGGAVLRYFLALEEGVNMLPGFAGAPGVYSETDPDGIKRLYGYVLKA